MRSYNLPTGFQWIDEVSAEPNTILAWDENGQRKVWMTNAPVGTPINETIRQLQNNSGTVKYDVVSGSGSTWLVRAVPDEEPLIVETAESVADSAESLLEYPEEWVTGRRRRTPRERTPMSSSTKRTTAMSTRVCD